MIARGDLAVEVGFERLAEVQEEILWMCEAAHVPVVWATQVLEQLTREGAPSRAEVSDAALGERAECVMLNKGPYLADAVRALDDILSRMHRHQEKKLPVLAHLGVADHFFAPAPAPAAEPAPVRGARPLRGAPCGRHAGLGRRRIHERHLPRAGHAVGRAGQPRRPARDQSGSFACTGGWCTGIRMAASVLRYHGSSGGRRTMVSQKSSIDRTMPTTCSRPTGLVA